MKNKIIKLLLFIIVLSSANTLCNAGTTGAEFLLIGVGARAMSFSGAYTAITDDVNSIYWNSAGLGKIASTEMTFMHNSWFADTNYEFFAMATPSRIGVFAVGVSYLNLGEFVGRRDQVSLPYSFTAYDMSANLAYGLKLTKKDSFGLNLKYIEENIEEIKSTAYAVDLGYQRLINNELSLGLSVKNLGSKIKYVEEILNLPLTITAGMAYRIGMVNMEMDLINNVYDNATSFSFGTEFAPFEIISFRGGYLFATGNSNKDTVGNITGGVGLKLGKDNRIDYAFTPFADLNNTHKISLTIKL